MIALPLTGGLPDEPGTYPGAMYEPVTDPNSYAYAIPAPSTAMPQQIAAPLTTVPLNTYVPDAPVAPSRRALPTVQPTASVAPNGGCGCGCGGNGKRLKWYEVATAIALVVIAVTAFTRK